MSARELDFYFDYLSPYAFLASREIGELCERHGALLHFKPVLFAGLLNHWGQLGPAEIAPKAQHVFKECLRHAILRGVEFRGPKHHPFRPLTALRVSLPEVAGDQQALVIETLFAFGWSKEGHLGGDAEIAGALDAVGLDGTAMVGRSSEPAIKQLLLESTEEAISRGVFGIPTMLIEDELFWGLDQLKYLDLYLSGRDPLRNVSMETFQNDGPSAWRPGVPPREP
jgi:2-hydroxychromene-2-carboxylate isomerase